MTSTMTPPVDISMPKQAIPQYNATASSDRKTVSETAQKFEAMFLNEMFSHMFDGIDEDNPFGGGHGEKMFRSMMVDQYAQLTARSGQTKIAASIEREMLRMQEEQRNPRGTVFMPKNA